MRITNSTLYEGGNLQATIEAGFTTVQSLGAAIDKDVRDAINAGAIPGPRLLTSIDQITEKSGAPAKLREMVRQTKAEGGDVIRIFATASIRDGGKQTMTDEQIAAVCGEAKAQGMRAVVHLYPADTARKVVLTGCTGSSGLSKSDPFLLVLEYPHEEQDFPWAGTMPAISSTRQRAV